MARPPKFDDKQKWCPGCKARLDHDFFYDGRNTASGLSDYCKKCHAAKNQPYVMAWNRKNRYGISADKFEEFWEKQGGCCAICKEPLKRKGTRKDRNKTCVDHDHATLTVRGLLCNSCNRGLGFLRDNVAILQNAIDYLQRLR